MSGSVPVESLAEHAHDTPVVVVGGGVAGLVAALECAEVGLDVTLLESAPEVGGLIRPARVGGVDLDTGADGWSTAGGAVRRLVERLGLDGLVQSEQQRATWVHGVPGGAAPLPVATVVGIPANAWDPSVRRIIGWGGAWRAYLDRLRPPLTIGQERSLGRLVRGRMGALVVDRLVAPLTHGRHGLLPDDVDVEFAAPGLSSALTRTGSLAGGVAQVLGDDGARRGGAETLEGGLGGLRDALAARIVELGARVLTGRRATALERGSSGWRVIAESEEGPESFDAAHVVVATEEDAAHALLAPHVRGLPAREPRAFDIVTLVLDSPALDAHPRGSAVYPLPGSSDASAVVVPSARWPWLAESAGDGAHVVRVQFSDRKPADPVAAAIEVACAVFAEPLASSVRDARVDRFPAALPPSALGQSARARTVRAAVQAVPGLAVAGAWVAGSGLAHVVPHAIETAERVRRRALFGASAVD